MTTLRSFDSAQDDICTFAAFTNPLNKGWGLVGLDLNSGWNWHPTYQGWSSISTISTSLSSGDSPVIFIPFSWYCFLYSLLNSYLCLCLSYISSSLYKVLEWEFS